MRIEHKTLSESIRAVERALDVLQCFTRQNPELSMTQIAEQIGIHKSTVHRLLATLERRRFVQRDPVTGLYRLGIRVMQMAYLTLEHNDLRRITAPYLRRLLGQFQETVHLAVLDDTDVVYVSIIESPQRVKLAASLGQHLPAFATASGKAIYAFMPEDAVKQLLDRGMPRYTVHTPVSMEALFEDFKKIRDQGFAISNQEYENEISAVAAPVFDLSGQPVASIAIAGPAYRLTLDVLEKIGPTLKAVADEVTNELTMSEIPDANLEKHSLSDDELEE